MFATADNVACISMTIEHEVHAFRLRQLVKKTQPEGMNFMLFFLDIDEDEEIYCAV